MTDVGELVVKIKADAAQLDREMQRARAITEDASKRIGSSVGSVRSHFLALATALSGGAFVKSITTFEKIEASLRTVTGSAARAADAFEMVQKFAVTTPFSLEEAAQGFIKLTALGLTPSEEALRSYGNTASAMGKSLNQMIEAVADATTGEFERLKEFGIKTRQEGDSVIFTFQGVSTKVGKSAREIEDYLRTIGDVNFAGAMKEQEGTLSTALSNMGDSFSQLAKAIGDAGVTDLLIGMANAIKTINDELAATINRIDSLPNNTNTASRFDLEDSQPTSLADMKFGQNPNRNRSMGPHTSSPLEEVSRTAPARSSSSPKAAENARKAREALEDYNRALREEGVLLNLSGRERDMQDARFRMEEIARKGGVAITREQVEATAELAAANYDLKKAQDDIAKSTREAEQVRALFYDRLTSSLTDVAFRANSARDAMLGFAESIARATFERKVAGPIVDSLIGSGGKAGLLDSIFGGFFADGGRPPMGKVSVVGERGPELFVPDSPGTIVPNGSFGGATVIVQQTIQINPGVPELINARIRESAPVIAAQAQAAVFSELQKGGAGSRITRLRN
jgi:hypothetical protein